MKQTLQPVERVEQGCYWFLQQPLLLLQLELKQLEIQKWRLRQYFAKPSGFDFRPRF